MGTVIEVSGIKKRYPLYQKKSDKIREAFSITGKKYHKDFEALKGVSFSVSKGECIGIIGLNGSGKSTLLKILTGVIQPTEGSIETRGKIAALLELGAGFNPEYTGLENVFLNTLLMGYTRAETERRLQEILAFADIGDFINQPVKIYSSGMYVRLAFAIAITVDPDILVIDEALSVGDVFFQQKCYNKIREFAEKSTVLIVSHDLNSITKFCKRILVMNNGVLIFDGNAKDAVVDSSYNSTTLSEGLQIKPYYDESAAIPPTYAEYRSQVTRYTVNKQLLATGYSEQTLANPQFGAGGLPQYFIENIEKEIASGGLIRGESIPLTNYQIKPEQYYSMIYNTPN